MKRRVTTSTTVAIAGAVPSMRAIDVTPLSRMPHGTMWPNIERSGSTLSANPCRVRPRATLTPIAPIFSSPTHTPVRRSRVSASMPRSASAPMSTASSAADVRHHVALAVAPLGQRDDRVPDELARTVVRDVAAAVGAHEGGAHARRRHEHVLERRLRAERVDVRVLEQQQVVTCRVLVQAPLERVGVGVPDPPEPADDQF